MSDQKPGEHKHGAMDTTEQERTFDGFVKVTKYVIYVIVALLLLLAIFRT
jgi:hypothetical protein